MSGVRRPLYGIRYKEGNIKPFSLLAEAKLCTHGKSPGSQISQSITATIAVGAFGRGTLFVTHNFVLAGALVLLGVGIDSEQTLYVADFEAAFRVSGGREVEVFDMISGDRVPVSADDPDVISSISRED
jgi:hypothetical protein